ncbi:FCD domain-containing protein [Nonomuraea sp. NPDC049152]|uniref:FCD domain-containing protein n=1 Tax=Nonomuraea sp. NPDC049152 TaxID=3154350 RepID=UPI0033EB7235
MQAAVGVHRHVRVGDQRTGRVAPHRVQVRAHAGQQGGRVLGQQQRTQGRASRRLPRQPGQQLGARVGPAVRQLSAELRLLIAQLHPTYGSVSDLAYEHELLLEALRSGNVQRTKAAWNEHFDGSERFFLELIQERAL